MPDLPTSASARKLADGGPTIRGLIAERGIERYALFFTTGEGRYLPDGQEEVSGSVLTQDGRCFGFWTGWDYDRGRPCFRLWHEEQPEPSWDESAEYRRARAAIGLA